MQTIIKLKIVLKYHFIKIIFEIYSIWQRKEKTNPHFDFFK